MDQAQVAQNFESSVKKNANRLLISVIAATVTLMAVLRISARWETYDVGAKFIAIIFVLILVTKQMFEILREAKRPQQLGRYRGPLEGYVLVIMAMMLFARH
jgi:hypothetical protein